VTSRLGWREQGRSSDMKRLQDWLTTGVSGASLAIAVVSIVVSVVICIDFGGSLTEESHGNSES
jgi:hypothetical protein